MSFWAAGGRNSGYGLDRPLARTLIGNPEEVSLGKKTYFQHFLWGLEICEKCLDKKRSTKCFWKKRSTKLFGKNVDETFWRKKVDETFGERKCRRNVLEKRKTFMNIFGEENVDENVEFLFSGHYRLGARFARAALKTFQQISSYENNSLY